MRNENAPVVNILLDNNDDHQQQHVAYEDYKIELSPTTTNNINYAEEKDHHQDDHATVDDSSRSTKSSVVSGNHFSFPLEYTEGSL